MQSRVAGILLAAGEGSRLGRPKALVEIGGQRLADRGVALLRAGGADPVIVVTGAAHAGSPRSLAGRNSGRPAKVSPVGRRLAQAQRGHWPKLSIMTSLIVCFDV